jgi:hypothetical protein
VAIHPRPLCSVRIWCAYSLKIKFNIGPPIERQLATELVSRGMCSFPPRITPFLACCSNQKLWEHDPFTVKLTTQCLLSVLNLPPISTFEDGRAPPTAPSLTSAGSHSRS